MVMKVCPHCGGKSYSSCAEGQWVCPYCKKDIAETKTEPAS